MLGPDCVSEIGRGRVVPFMAVGICLAPLSADASVEDVSPSNLILVLEGAFYEGPSDVVRGWAGAVPLRS